MEMDFLRLIPAGGTLFNSVAVIAGSLLGLLIGRFIPERLHHAIFQCFGLFCFYMGTSMALKLQDVLICLTSLTAGTIIGELADLETRLERTGDFLKAKLSGVSGDFTDGFVTSTLLYCVGSMAILGSIENGVSNNPDLLITKGTMDGVSSILLAASLGIGVLFSSLPILIYQGALTVGASWCQGFISPAMINNISGVGGIMILAIGLNLLKITKVKTCNMLPAIFLVIILSAILG